MITLELAVRWRLFAFWWYNENYILVNEVKEEKKSLKKVSLAVVKQRRKEAGTAELLKTLDEYVSFYRFHFIELFENIYWFIETWK